MSVPGPHFAAACALVRAGCQSGTGYLVTPDRVATCWHVVKEVPIGAGLEVEFEHGPVHATVAGVDEERDAALLALAEAVTATPPLRLGGLCASNVPWDSFGYPAIAGGAGIPLAGIVGRHDGRDDRKRPALQLRCQELAHGVAGGFSGSPVLVDHAVVGHFKRVIPNRASNGHPIFGIVYATPVRAVADLLGIVTTSGRPRPTRPSLAVPALDPDTFHVAVRFAPGDKAWADALIARLEGTGLVVCAVPLTARADGTADETPAPSLARSQAAIVLFGSRWRCAAGSDAALAALTERAKGDAAFRLLPVQLDDTPLPVPLRPADCLAFDDPAGPSGPALEQLLASLATTGATPAVASARVFHAEQEATDELFAEVRAAAAAGPRRVLDVWRCWDAAGLPARPAALFVAQTLIGQARPQAALDVLDAAGGDGLRAAQLRALALAKRRRTDEAIETLVQLREAGALDAETLGLLGGRYKEKWLRSRQTPMLQAAFDAYSEAWRRTRDPFAGINTAATALLLKRRAEATTLAGEIVTELGARDRATLSRWDVATLAEALLIVGRLDEARTHYGQATALDPMAVENIAVMRRQARLELAALGHAADALDDVLAVPRVTAFVGHMTDAPDRPQPRFPRGLVGKVRRAVRDALEARRIGFGVSSAARGSDILFLEELLERGGRAQVVLPFPAEAFVGMSVGEEWKARFDALLDDIRVEPEVLAPAAPPAAELPKAFAACNRAVIERAVAFARLLDEEPMLLAVWDGAPGDGAGGTADAVQTWQDEGHDVEIIDIRELGR